MSHCLLNWINDDVFVKNGLLGTVLQNNYEQKDLYCVCGCLSSETIMH